MTCQHRAGDPECGRDRYSYSAPTPATPDATRYEIIDAVHVPETMRLVVKVKYPNCASCAYEGIKVLVYNNVTPLDALKWKRVDPHFAAPKRVKVNPTEAPSPIARFPASDDGWNAALWFAAKFSS